MRRHARTQSSAFRSDRHRGASEERRARLEGGHALCGLRTDSATRGDSPDSMMGLGGTGGAAAVGARPCKKWSTFLNSSYDGRWLPVNRGERKGAVRGWYKASVEECTLKVNQHKSPGNLGWPRMRRYRRPHGYEAGDLLLTWRAARQLRCRERRRLGREMVARDGVRALGHVALPARGCGGGAWEGDKEGSSEWVPWTGSTEAVENKGARTSARADAHGWRASLGARASGPRSSSAAYRQRTARRHRCVAAAPRRLRAPPSPPAASNETARSEIGNFREVEYLPVELRRDAGRVPASRPPIVVAAHRRRHARARFAHWAHAMVRSSAPCP